LSKVAKRLAHDWIGTEHLLLGIVREGEDVATGILDRMGVKVEGSRRSSLEEN
jgi:ATP-dependent Clp protease ATP-binding subunit ClpC